VQKKTVSLYIYIYIYIYKTWLEDMEMRVMENQFCGKGCFNTFLF
jgi:hypothetical protein